MQAPRSQFACSLQCLRQVSNFTPFFPGGGAHTGKTPRRPQTTGPAVARLKDDNASHTASPLSFDTHHCISL